MVKVEWRRGVNDEGQEQVTGEEREKQQCLLGGEGGSSSQMWLHHVWGISQESDGKPLNFRSFVDPTGARKAQLLKAAERITERPGGHAFHTHSAHTARTQQSRHP